MNSKYKFSGKSGVLPTGKRDRKASLSSVEQGGI